jgi:X8 domain
MELATNLPPKTNDKLCSCMMLNLNCIIPAGNESQAEDSSQILYNLLSNYPGDKGVVDQACSQNHTRCLGIRVNTTSGQYGAFSVCNKTERSSWVLNQLYISDTAKEETCRSLNGIVVQKGTSEPLQYSCKVALEQAGPEGTGTVTYAGERDSASKGLSTAGRVAIGSVVGVVVCLAIGGFLWFRRLKKNRSASQNTESWGKAELPDNTVIPEQRLPTEISGQERLEIGGSVRLEADDTVLNELPTISNEPVELDGNQSRSRNSCTEKGE